MHPSCETSSSGASTAFVWQSAGLGALVLRLPVTVALHLQTVLQTALLIFCTRTMFGIKRWNKRNINQDLRRADGLSVIIKISRGATLGSPATAWANDAWVTRGSLPTPPAVMQIQHAIELSWSTSSRYFLLSVRRLISSRLFFISTSFSPSTVAAQEESIKRGSLIVARCNKLIKLKLKLLKGCLTIKNDLNLKYITLQSNTANLTDD